MNRQINAQKQINIYISFDRKQSSEQQKKKQTQK